MNPIQKLINMFKRKKNAPKYTQCLTHRTWLSRQVEEEILKEKARVDVVAKEDNWYARYL